MMSVILCSRANGNPASNTKRLLDTLVEHTTPEERDRLEVLIKYDTDDDRPADEFFAAYPLTVRTFCWNRGEGPHHLHHAREYLFAQRDPRSRFVLMPADDFYFTRTGFVTEILAGQEEFCILGQTRPPIEMWAARPEPEQAIHEWAALGAVSPVVSTRLIEVCQNFGWQANLDYWLAALSVALYDLYQIVVWRQVEPFCERDGRPDLADTPTYNNMEPTGLHGPDNKYWFELVRRQARNLYLNMMDGTSLDRLGWGPRRLWRKLRSQPMSRLSGRLVRRIKRDLRILPG